MINNETSRAVYAGDGQSAEFIVPFTFGVNEAGVFGKKYQLAVYKCAAQDADGTTPASAALNEDTDYEVSENKVILFTAPQEGEKIVILRDVPLTQHVKYCEQEALPVASTGRALDKLTQIAQEHAELLARTLRVDPADTQTPVQAEEYLNTVVSAASQAKESIDASKDAAVSAGAQAVKEAEKAVGEAQEASRLVGESVSTLTGYVQEANQAKTDAKGFAQAAQKSAQTAAGAAEEAAAAALAESKNYTDAKTGEVRELVNALQLVKFVDVLPKTGESKYLYAVPQDELTLDGEHIVLLFVWNETDGWTAVGVQTTAVDLTDYAKKTELAAETDAREAADQTLQTALAQKYGTDNLAAGNGIEIKELLKAGGIDQHTLAVWHFDDDNDPYSPAPASSYFQGNLGGNASAVSAQAKFGNKSLQLSAAGSYFGAVVRDWDLFAGDFTLEFWHRIGNNLGVTICGISNDQVNFDVRNFPFKISSGSLGSYSNNRLQINDVELNPEVEEPQNQWNHIAVTFKKKTGTATLYLNGGVYGSTVLSSVPTGACNLTFYQQSAATQYVDEVRVSNTVRYAGDFTPRTEAYYDDSGAPEKYEISAKGGGVASLPLFTPHFFDHAPEDISWVKANYSQLSKAVYPDAYAKLLEAFNGAEAGFKLSGGDTALSDKLRLLLYGLTKYTDTNITFDNIGTIDVDAVTWRVGTLRLIGMSEPRMSLNMGNGKTVFYEPGDPCIMVSANGYTAMAFPNLDGSGASALVVPGTNDWTVGRDAVDTGETVTTAQAPTDIFLFAKADNGMRIVDAQDASAVAQVQAEYAAHGIAWYYLLNTAEEWFKLPRNDWFFQGGNTPGERVEAGLPNIVGAVSGIRVGTWAGTGALSKTAHTSTTSQTMASVINQQDITLTLDASGSSPVYGQADTVQPAAVKMALYFYLGGHVQDAATVDAGALSEQLNAKADLDLANVPAAGKTRAASWAFADYGRAAELDLTSFAGVGEANAKTFTATAYGWIHYSTRTEVGNVTYYRVNTSVSGAQGAAAVNVVDFMIPLGPGDTFKVWVDVAGPNVVYAQEFIYAKGN